MIETNIALKNITLVMSKTKMPKEQFFIVVINLFWLNIKPQKNINVK